MNHGSIHNPDTVPARVYRALRYSPNGLTTMEIQKFTKSMAVSTDVSAVREQLPDGWDVDCEYEGRTEDSRKVYRYRLVQIAKAGSLF